MNDYIRKIASIVLTLIFCIAVIVGAGVILSIRNVNVEYLYFSSRGDEEYGRSHEKLDSLKGRNLMFLDEEDIYGCVSGEVISVESYEKIFPCTLNVVLKERLEQYVRPTSSGGYDVYDSQGGYMGTRQENINPADSSPNVLISVDDEVFDSVISACGAFKQNFGTIRNLISRVTAGYDKVTGMSNLTFEFYSGMKLVVVNYEELASEKISAASDCYNSLSHDEKLHGSIYAGSSGGGQSGVYASYNPLI